MNTNLQSITANLMVDDVDATVAFYDNVLGFKLEMSVPRDDGKLQWAMVTSGDTQLMFHEKENFLEEVPELEGFGIGGSLTLFIQMQGLDTYYEKVKELAEVIREPNVTFYGMKEFTIHDLNGYILTFAEPQENQKQ